jgi:hypothetical protein
LGESEEGCLEEPGGGMEGSDGPDEDEEDGSGEVEGGIISYRVGSFESDDEEGPGA